MIEFDPSAQPRFIDSIEKPSIKSPYAEKVFDEPEFMSFELKNKKEFELRWSAHDRLFRKVDAITDVLMPLNKGGSAVEKSSVVFDPNAEGIEASPVPEDRIVSYSLLIDGVVLHGVHNVDRTPTHDTPTNEIWLRLKSNDTAARYIVSKCVEISARPVVKENIEAILDEFADYMPILGRTA